MERTFDALLSSLSSYIIASWDVPRTPVCSEEYPSDCVMPPVSAELFDAAAAVLCDLQGCLITVQELLDYLSAQILVSPEKTPEDLEYELFQNVVSTAQSLGPISREALLYVARYAVNPLDELEEVDDDDGYPSALYAQWNALSPGEQSREWHRCAELCAQGLGDTHWFYPILMPQMLAGYVGD
jgi:hypothetical protein